MNAAGSDPDKADPDAGWERPPERRRSSRRRRGRRSFIRSTLLIIFTVVVVILLGWRFYRGEETEEDFQPPSPSAVPR